MFNLVLGMTISAWREYSFLENRRLKNTKNFKNPGGCSVSMAHFLLPVHLAAAQGRCHYICQSSLSASPGSPAPDVWAVVKIIEN